MKSDAESAAGRIRRSVSSILIIVAAVTIFFLPVLFFNYTLIPQNPGDVVAGVATEQLAYHTADPSGSFHELSYGNFLKQTVLSGQIPFWSPFQGLGHPFLGDSLFSALFAPATVLRVLLPSAQWGIICVLNALLGSLSIYFLCLEYGCTHRGAVVGGITYLAVGTTLLYICVFSVTSVAAWAPLFMLGIDRLMMRPSGNRRADYACAILGAYGVVTGGHISITLLTLVLAAIYCTTRLIQLRSLTGAGRIALAGAIAVLITAVHWLPFIGYATYRGDTYGDFVTERYALRNLPAFVFPYIYGHLTSAQTGTTPPIDISRSGSLGWLPPGVLPLFLAGAIFLASRRAWRTGPFALALTAAVMWLFAFNVPPFNLFYHLPFMGRIRGDYVPVTTGWVLCVITALGFSRIEEKTIRLRTLAVWTFAVLGAAILGCGVLFLIHHVAPRETARYLLEHSQFALLWAVTSILTIVVAARRPTADNVLFAVGIGLPLLSAIFFFPWASEAAVTRAHETALGCFVAAFVTAYFSGRKWPGVAPGTMALASMAVAALISRSFVMAAPNHLPLKHDLFQTSAYDRFLQHHMRPGDRAYGLDGFLFPNLGSAYGISTPNRVTAILSLQDERFFHHYLDSFQPPEQVTGLDLAGPRRSPLVEFNRHRSCWDYLGVRYIVSKRSVAESNATGVAVFRNGLWSFPDRPESIFGLPGDVPVVSDWNGDGALKAGVVRKVLWLPDWNGNQKWDNVDAHHTYWFGQSGDIPITGDWNGDGRTKAGVFRHGLWLPDWSGSRAWNSINDHHTYWFGQSGDIPITGDWNGDGRTKAGVFRNGLWFLDWNGDHVLSSTDSRHSFRFGQSGDIPIAGDWNGDGRIKVGIFRDGLWLLDWNGNHEWDDADARHAFHFGAPGDIPLVWPRGTSERPTPMTQVFDDRATHALVIENSDAQTRAYLAPKTEIALDWQHAQDRFASQKDLRKTAFVEPGGACASSESSPDQMGRVSAIRIDVNRVQMDVEARHAGMLVLVDAFMPGWTARLDGVPAPVVRINGTFRGACIGQPGNHRVVMEYRPPHWHFATGLSAMGVLMFAGLLFLRRLPLG